MPTREIMQALGQEILVSYDARAKGVAEIKSSVRSELAGLDRAHRVMSTRLRADLARGAADRRRTVGAQLAALDRAHKAMGGKLRSDLAKGVSDRKAMVDSQLAGLSGARKAMGAELRTGLDRGVADRRRAVGTQLAAFDSAHRAMGGRLHADLARGVADRRVAVGARLAQFGSEMKELATAHAGGQAAWRGLTATMQARRGKPMAKAAYRTATVPRMPRTAPAAPPTETAAGGAGDGAAAARGVAEMTQEFAELCNRVFAYLADHPDGTRLMELEHEFHVARIQMARVVKSLMDGNKVEKRDLLYFAV